MKRAPVVCGVVTIALAAVAASPAAAVPSLLRPSPAQVRPQAFASCPALISYASKHYSATHGLPEPPVAALAQTASGGSKVPGAPLAAPSASGSTGSAGGSPSYSTTNDQEQGVDEPDIVKTDGSTIFTVSQNKLYAVAVDGGNPSLVGTLDLGTNGYGSQLLLDGNRLLVISSARPLLVPVAAPGVGVARPLIAASPYYSWGGQTTLTEVDVRDPSAMSVTQTMSIDGSFVAGRQNGDTARIVISSAPHAIVEPQLKTQAGGWIPTRRFHDLRTGRRFTRSVASCTSIRRPVQFSGLGMLTIVTVDLAKGLGLAQSESLMADAQVVYGSQDSLYVATQKWVDPTLAVTQLPAAQTTVIDRFDVSDPDTTTFVASGEVPGYLLNQYSLSEYGGYLRVATTSRPIWWGTQPQQITSQSYVTVLATSGNMLSPVGQVSGLGQGEQIYSVRFIDDTGYVVTYKQVDPLYTIDLSTPSAPRVAGQLDLSGYSAYLHPVGNGLLLGIGSAVDPATNEPSGTQLDLFDVSNPAAPKLLQQLSVGTGSSSTVQYDQHAFLFWPPTDLAVLPVQIYATTGGGQAQPFTGAIGYHVDSSGIAEVGRVVHDAVNGTVPAIERSLVIGTRLYTVSAGGVMASTLDTLTRQAFAAFPAPAASGPIPQPATAG